MKTHPALRYLWHPGTLDTFSGYGLALAPVHLVGLVMIDRPRPADPAWLTEVKHAFGAYQLAAMTQTGERGIVCQMHIAQESLGYLKTFDHALAYALSSALMPLLLRPPAVTLALRWKKESQAWVSTIVKGKHG